jgi:PAS domain S-box-containing protein
MPDPYYVRDMDYNVILWPEAIAKLTGYSESEAKTLKCYDMFKACVCPPGRQCPTQQCIQSRQFLKDVAVDVYHKNGSTVHTLVSNAGVYDKEGNPIGAVEIVKDNTVIQASMKSIGEIIKHIDGLATELATAFDKVNASNGIVNEKTAESLKNVKIGVDSTNNMFGKAENSSKHANSVHNNMKGINESMKFSVDKISALKEKSENIIKIVSVIQEISAKTNLLAINASIEAAHAGESGRGFKVVADGIRELSRNSSESATSIKQTIQEIMVLVTEATKSLNVTEHNIEAGTNNISELLMFVKEIDEASKMLMGTIGSIEDAVNTAGQLGAEQTTSVTAVSKDSKELSEIAKKLTVEFDRVFNAIQHTNMG